MNSLLSGPLSLSDLMFHKVPEPLTDAEKQILQELATLDVTKFKEVDVREDILTPLLRVLGYQKGKDFSIQREEALQVPGRKRYPDYTLRLWKEQFWLIEAKRPKSSGFSGADIEQAMCYAGHPKINAALVVLCDGLQSSIFDREESILKPALTVDIVNLQQHIRELQAVLSPWQVWFFEKRRIVRYLDKVFNKEFNITRLEEFKSLVSKRLDAKQRVVIDNMRSTLENADSIDEIALELRSSEPADLVEVAFFLGFNLSSTTAIAESLVRHCCRSSFPVLYRVFPDYARNMNDHYCMHALNFLIHLHESEATVNWLPAWLGQGNDLEHALNKFIEGCLTYFAFDPVRRHILLCAAALRRLFKALMVVDENVWSKGKILHVIERYEAPEDSWPQILSSPERQNLLRLDGLVKFNVGQLIGECSDSRGEPQCELIERRLREIWEAEARAVGSIPSYTEFLKARRVEEVHPTEAIAVVYDYLGHGSLSVVDDHPNWKAYILKHHKHHIETLARMGSRQARKWIEGEEQDSYTLPKDDYMAARFFLGDVDMYCRLRTAYGYD